MTTEGDRYMSQETSSLEGPANADSEGVQPAPLGGNGGWVKQLDREEFSVVDSIGGWRGAVESLAPGLIFVVAYVASRDLFWPLVLSGGLAAVFVVIRLFQRSSLSQAFAGMFGVLIGVVWAALSGQAENYFAWGLITNAAFLVAMLISLIVRRPALLLLMEFAIGLPADWKSAEWAPLLRKRATYATWVWVLVFGLRLGVQAPLYFGGQVVGLGVLKLVMGLPLFAVAGWLTWVLLRGFAPVASREAGEGQVENLAEAAEKEVEAD
ncbi:DUF3159 domain-containing protein [Actinomyces minihominis]|uniref:DUF3159 domain-containing protein n=1 Tax=Actinomyces minihominis TaxID=2002838 RepID=UPI000C06ABC0|nr:DUF3159 domain-containing protein [Actinomyces minihominis]